MLNPLLLVILLQTHHFLLVFWRVSTIADWPTCILLIRFIKLSLKILQGRIGSWNFFLQILNQSVFLSQLSQTFLFYYFDLVILRLLIWLILPYCALYLLLAFIFYVFYNLGTVVQLFRQSLNDLTIGIALITRFVFNFLNFFL